MAAPPGTNSTPSQQKADSAARTAPAAARPAVPTLRRNATDDEILGLTSGPGKNSALAGQPEAHAEVGEDPGSGERDGNHALSGAETESAMGDTVPSEGEPEQLREVFEANPELRGAWRDAQAYRKAFATPQEAVAATALLADLNRLDALFFSRRPEDHTQLAHAIAELDPAAFASLARAINAHLGGRAAQGQGQKVGTDAPARENSSEMRAQGAEADTARGEAPGLTQAQAEFFQSANASAVEGVLGAIELQVERLLPEGVPKNARTRVVAEIYRELDATLRSNRQLAQQMGEAFRSGSLDAEHQRAVVSLITGRARQALPGVAKRVLQEWTSTLVAANQERRARQRSAERRVDIAGSGGAGNEGRRAPGPRDIDYARMSDADILNL